MNTWPTASSHSIPQGVLGRACFDIIERVELDVTAEQPSRLISMGPSRHRHIRFLDFDIDYFRPRPRLPPRHDAD